jgi:hypothetical protein
MEFPEVFEPENEQGNSWDLLPVGEYVAQVVEASVEQPKSGDGHYVKLVWKVVEGEYEGRQLWQRVTYVHSSPQAVEIGRKTLKDLCVALGINEHIESVEPFLFKTARIKVGIEVDKNGQYDDQNRIKRILPLASTPKQQETSPKPQDAPQQQEKPAPAAKPTASTSTKGPARPASAGPAPWHQQRQ